MAVLTKLLTTPPRERSGSFSGASIGYCERRQVLAYLGGKQGVIDPQLANIFADGRYRHLRWQAFLLASGVLDEAEYEAFWRKYKSRGTLDGIGTVPDDHPHQSWRGLAFGYELKGVSTFQFGKLKQSGPLEKHMYQVAMYFLLTGLKLFVIMYEDKTTQEFKEWVIEADHPEIQEYIRKAEAEVKRLSASVDQKTLPIIQTGCMKRTGDEFNNCPFNQVCHKAGTWPHANQEGFEHSKFL